MNNETEEKQEQVTENSEPTFTDEQQERIDQLIAQKVAKERKRSERKMAEQEKQFNERLESEKQKITERAKMSAEERAKAEQADREKELQAKNAEVDRKLNELSTKSMLIDEGISRDMLPLVMGRNEDETSRNLELLKKYGQQIKESVTAELLKGKQAPAASTPSSPKIAVKDNPWSEDAWNLTEQQRICTEDPDKARELIAQVGAIHRYHVTPVEK